MPESPNRRFGNLFDSDDNGHKTLVSEMTDESQDSVSDLPDPIPLSKEDAALELPLSQNALTVLERRYMKRDENGEVIETPVQLFRRVARCIAEADLLYDSNARVEHTEASFFSIISELKFLPNSPTLMNAGRELGQLSACFVLPIEDSMESIFNAVKNTALIHKSGGGTGFSFSRIRPKNDIVQSTRGIASGPISFLHVFDAATETVKQGGTRRGANMAILRVDHPDIMDFIHCKENHDNLNNFNISVAITETFWEALNNETEYDLINPHTGETAGSLNAKDVFESIVNHAWENGDPGVIFIDRINKDNVTPQFGPIESTNPCGEQPLLPYESCNLGSINLATMVKGGDEPKIDYTELVRTVRTAVHFLDNVIDVNRYPLECIEKQSKATRKIGLGVMGFADMLIKLGIPYDSDEAIEIAGNLMRFINVEARKKSEELAIKRGAFPAFNESVYAKRGEPKIRNATRTTIAPTGTISIIAGCSSGIEPLFALSFTRHVLDDDKLPEIHPEFVDRIKAEGLYSDDLMRRVASDGSVRHIKEIPEAIRQLFPTAHDIAPEWHIRMQAAFQKHTENAVSKTVNFANSATRDDVASVYCLAHDLGCKGVTIYRDGSRTKQVLNRGNKTRSASGDGTSIVNRPRILNGCTTKLNTGQGSLYVTINIDESNSPVEVFANIGKSGGDTAALAEAIGRLISIALKKRVNVEELSHTLIGITGSRPVWNEGILVKSVPDGIGQILLNQFGDSVSASPHTASDHPPSASQCAQTGPECPECGSSMETEGGCSVCRICGYSHCG